MPFDIVFQTIFQILTSKQVLVSFGLIGFLFFLLFVLKKLGAIPETKESLLPYQLLPSVFNKSEMAFFFELQKELPGGFYVFPKMRIIDFIDPRTRDYKWRNKIWAKHVDFLICNQYFKPVLAVEIDGKSHLSPDRIERDIFVRRVFESAQLPFKAIKVGTNFQNSIREIKDALAKINSPSH